MTTLTARPFTIWWTDRSRDVRFLTMDAVMEEIHTGNNTISKYPVQRGFEVSDHTIRRNRVFRAKGVVTNYIPKRVEAQEVVEERVERSFQYVTGTLLAPGGALYETTGQPIREQFLSDFKRREREGEVEVPKVIRPDFSTSRTVRFFNSIKELHQEAYLCRIGTILETYNPVVLTSFNMPHSIENSSILTAELTFEEVIVLDSEGDIIQNVAVADVSDREALNALDKSIQGTRFNRVQLRELYL